MGDIDIGKIFIGFLAITIGITVHEFAHAFVADRLGDPTPREHGRLTLNPMVLWTNYPFGSLLAPLVGAYSGFLLGWAATPVSIHKVRRGVSLRKAQFLISAAGPASNVIVALVSILALAPIYLSASADHSLWYYPLARLLEMVMLANVLLAVFNMLPIPPLDGFDVLSSVAPRSWEKALGHLRDFGMLLLLLIIFRGEVIFGPVFKWVYGTLFFFVQLFN